MLILNDNIEYIYECVIPFKKVEAVRRVLDTMSLKYRFPITRADRFVVVRVNVTLSIISLVSQKVLNEIL